MPSTAAPAVPTRAGPAPPPAPAAGAPPLRLVPVVCPLCRVEDADPVGVGEDFEYRTSPDTFLAVRCRRCRLVYLNPRPADGEAGRIYPDHYHAFQFRAAEYGLVYRVRRRLEARRLLRWGRGLPPGARVLDIGCGDGFHLQLLRDYGPRGWTLEGADTDARAVAAARRAGLTVHHGRAEDLPPGPGYDLVLMIMTVEHLSDPVGVVRAAAGLLALGGRLVVVTDNVASPDFRVFGGRHWGGYHFPRHAHLFDRRTLARLGVEAGLEVERVTTAVSPVNWVYSVRNWLDDWGAPRRLVRCFSLNSAPALAAFTLLDMPLAAAGFGAVLHARFRRPMGVPS